MQEVTLGGLRPQLRRCARRPRGERIIEHDDTAHPLRRAQCQFPYQRGPEIQADEDRLFRPHVIEQAEQIADDGAVRIVLDIGRDVRAPVSTQIRRDGPVARRGHRRELAMPHEPGVRKAVAEDHRMTLALFGDMHANAVGRHEPMGRIHYGLHSLERVLISR